MEIGEMIVKLRKERGLTQEQLAENLYVSRQAVSKWETGAAQPDLDNIRALSRFFGVSTDLFLQPPAIEDESFTDNVQAEEERGEEEAEKPSRFSRPTRIGVFVILAVTVCWVAGWAALPYLLRRYGMLPLYSWLPSLLAAAGVLVGGGVSAFLCLRKRRYRRGILGVAAVSLLCAAVSVAMWVFDTKEAQSYQEYLTFAPGGKELVLLRQDPDSGTTSLYRRRMPFLVKKSSDLPYPMEGAPKLDWMTDDVCTVTYMGKEDGAVHQYVATFGDRGPGSYYYVQTALLGNWSGAEEGTEDWSIRVTDGNNGGVSLQVGDQLEEFYAYEDCVQFGTTALVLCRGGLPRWTLTLNTDCTIDGMSNLVAPGGTVLLTQVSMQDTPSYVFRCDDDGKKQEEIKDQEILDTPKKRQEQELVSSIRRLAERKYITQDEVPDGAGLITEPSEDIPWMLFLAFVETDDSVMGANGVDAWIRWDAVQLVAGDTSDGCWKITRTNVFTSPGNQGAAPSSEQSQSSFYLRLVRTAGGDYMYVSSNDDLSFGLPQADAEVIDLSDNDAFHRFSPADYSGENWKYMNVDRLSPEEAAQWLYENQFADQYPDAAPLQNNARAGYVMDDAGTYLLYDGIWEEDGRWVYRFWLYQADSPSIAEWDGQVRTIGFYDVDFSAYEK